MACDQSNPVAFDLATDHRSEIEKKLDGLTDDLLCEIEKKLDGLTDDLLYLGDQIRTGKLPGSNNNASHININAGGVAIWVAVTACLCSAVITIVVAIFFRLEMSDLKTSFNTEVSDIRDTEKLHRAYIDKLRQDQKK